MADYNETQLDQQRQFARRSINSDYSEREQPTNQDKQKRVRLWLSDAYTMESEGAKALTQHAQAAEGYPEVQAKLRQHAEETRQHAEKVKGCVQRLGGQPSAARETLGTVVGSVRGVVTQSAKDTVVKNILADYASEHFEIACYKSLIAAAEEVGDRETVQVCRDILEEEEAMVASLDQQIAPVTQQFMAREASGAQKGQERSPNEQGGFLKTAQKNVPAIAGVLATVAGAGALAAWQVLGGGSKGQQGSREDGSEDEPTETTYDTSYEYERDAQSYGQPYGAEAGSYDQTPQPSYLQGEVREMDSIEVGSTEIGNIGMDSVEADSIVAEVTREDHETTDPTADEINAYLERNSQVDASDIEVVIGESGRVTLKGTVDSEETKRLAKEIAKDIPNVDEVHNHLKVK